MRFSDIKPTEFMVNDDGSGDFILETTGELMDLANDIRKKAGMTDLVTADVDNEVWYNFYLAIDVNRRTGEIWFTSNNSDKTIGRSIGFRSRIRKERLCLILELATSQPRNASIFLTTKGWSRIALSECLEGENIMTEMQISFLSRDAVEKRYGNDIVTLARSFEEQKPGALYDPTAFAETCFGYLQKAYIDHSRGWWVEAATDIRMLCAVVVPKWSREHAALEKAVDKFDHTKGIRYSRLGDTVLDLIGEAENALIGKNRYDRDYVPMCAYWDQEAVERFATRMRNQGVKRDPMGDKVYEALLSISAAAYSDMLRMDDPDEDVFGLVRQMIDLLPDWTKEKELLSHAYVLYAALNDPMAIASVYKRILFGEKLAA